MFQETLIRAEAEYRMARAQETAGRSRRRRFSGRHEPRVPTGSFAQADLSRLVPTAIPELEPSTIDDDSTPRTREHVAV